ncbi:nucleotidyltransferase family protein [Capnocytophaga sp.]|uniref:nucleotidyltransferase family protein n=1 Tax=Capnocytophaga sp. TaxID=44737 RepID=UPI0026DAC063|nr:nucleotidyltransferase domain-containing protein [Capnocytophaga sp.]MDO5106107.1 nucleotidyltransferase domain-containing protein [Capnocytophaga sp.]
MKEIQKYHDSIIAVCKKHKVSTLYAFGSVVGDDFSLQSSDIDLLVEFQPIDLLDYANNYFDLLFVLQGIFNRKVDLVTEKSLKNPYFIEEINKTKQLIYAKAG